MTSTTDTFPSAIAFSRLRQGIHGSRIIVRLWSDSDAEALFAAIDKARSLLNYQPATRLGEGLEQFVRWLEGES